MFFVRVAVGQIMYDFLFFGVKLPIKPISTRPSQRPSPTTDHHTGSACQHIRCQISQELIDVRVTSRSRILDRLRNLTQLRGKLG
ncbi:hypothetical protein WS66_22180 [Burkholderia sp. LA-2-3-30-S1-D2]|nr:hypothetical protein WS66_22180 [Burkholderia sp. LA-2-3-30-S1-D2]KVE12578.1 hypothetical protein WS66_16385 [Burkholderia sp. LA-2-3-30-S1-D2]